MRAHGLATAPDLVLFQRGGDVRHSGQVDHAVVGTERCLPGHLRVERLGALRLEGVEVDRAVTQIGALGLRHHVSCSVRSGVSMPSESVTRRASQRLSNRGTFTVGTGVTRQSNVGYVEDRCNLGAKTTIVVGGGGGIGAADTEALARAGAAVAFCDIDAAAVEATAARLDEIGARNLGRVADDAGHHGTRRLLQRVDTAFDHLDVLVNVAAAYGNVASRALREQWHDDIHRNFGYALDSIAAALPRVLAPEGTVAAS